MHGVKIDAIKLRRLETLLKHLFSLAGFIGSARAGVGLIAFCLLAGAGRSTAGAASLSLAGAVTVTVEPAEAAQSGARWSVNGSAPQESAQVVGNLVPGTHAIQFNNLPGWLEPDVAEVLVIGGKQASVTARYRPLPHFYFRAVPEQRPQTGKIVEFIVHTDEPSDPENPGPGVALQMTATPPPAGPLSFDSGSGRITYTPSVADRLPFTVRMATSQGVVGSFEVTPLNALPADAGVIEYDRPLPDPESRDYIQISEVPNGSGVFNDATQETFTISISGHTLVFANEHPANLHRQLNTRQNIRSLHLYADRVIFRSPLVLPQTAITIHARELRFEGDGRIETTPRARVRRPPGAVWEDDLYFGHSGDPGHSGGEVNAYIERFFSDATTSTRFVLRGGDGGPAGEGRDGRSELSVNFLSADWYKLMSRAGNIVCGTTESSGVMLYFEDRFNGTVQDICGARVTARGENAVQSGSPGIGGTGGTLRSTLNLSAYGMLSGGTGGPRAGNHIGGSLSGRAFIYRIQNVRFDQQGNEIITVSDSIAPKASGQSATAPLSFPGASGAIQVVSTPGTWIHSFAIRSIIQWAKDAYLNGRISETRRVLGEYQELLRAHERIIPPNAELTDEDFAEKVNLDQLLAEIENLVHRLDSNLDYFGNPAGWVPMLSFEANFLAFQNEIEHSVPILYLAYWLNHAATNLQATLLATEEAKAGLDDERVRMETVFNEAQAVIPRLKTEAETIAFRIGTLNGSIAVKLAELEQRAQQNVVERNKLPFWKKSLGVLSVMADLVPIAQPTVGRIGAGLGLLAQVDPDKPLQSAKALAPKAYGVMTNKSITVCFGTNAPPITVTNAPGSTNSSPSTNNVKRARQDKLKGLTQCAKYLGSELKELAAVFKEAQVDDKELAAELEKLKAADTNLLALTAELTTLNADKERFAAELAAALQAIGSFSSGLAENLVATHELEDRITANLNVLDHGALMHIKEMERRAKDRLVRYQYFLAKSFQYRQLRPFNGNLQLTRLFTRFQQLVEASTSHILSQTEFENLKGIFVNELREIVAQSLDNFNAPSRSLPKSYRLSSEQRRQLNEQGRLLLNLKDIGLINAGDENVRLADLRTRTLTTRPVGGTPGSLALVRVNFEHAGVSRLTSSGRTYLFRHYQTEGVNPIVWNAIYDANTGQTVNSTLSAAQQSLIAVLLAGQPVPTNNLLFYSQPGAHAEILLTKDVSSDNGTDFVIEDLLFEIQYDFTSTSGNLRELNVRVSGDLAPVIALSQADVNSRQDGRSDFSRYFPSFTLVTLQAPSTYGQYVFDRWLVNNQPQTTQVPAVAVFLMGSTQVEARYRLVAPLMLTPTLLAPGLIGLNFSSEPGATYVLEQSPSLINPNWVTVDTRTGDGSIIQISRPVGTGSAAFFRLRQAP